MTEPTDEQLIVDLRQRGPYMSSIGDRLAELLAADAEHRATLERAETAWRRDIDRVRAELANMIERNRLLRDRPDLPIERTVAYDSIAPRLDMLDRIGKVQVPDGRPDEPADQLREVADFIDQLDIAIGGRRDDSMQADVRAAADRLDQVESVARWAVGILKQMPTSLHDFDPPLSVRAYLWGDDGEG